MNSSTSYIRRITSWGWDEAQWLAASLKANVVDPHWFQCGAGSRSTGSRTTGSRSTGSWSTGSRCRDLMTFILRPPWRTFKLQETPPSKALQNMKFLQFFFCGSVLSYWIWIRIQPTKLNACTDLDPQHWSRLQSLVRSQYPRTQGNLKGLNSTKCKSRKKCKK